jgi:hypothetical protein
MVNGYMHVETEKPRVATERHFFLARFLAAAFTLTVVGSSALLWVAQEAI